jgi:prophage regulatory protein
MSNGSGKDFGSNEIVLRIRGVQQATGLGRSTLYELQNKGGPRYDPSFPRPVPLGPRARGYFKAEVLAWLVEKAKQRK